MLNLHDIYAGASGKVSTASYSLFCISRRRMGIASMDA
jgi:hypothetical protein